MKTKCPTKEEFQEFVETFNQLTPENRLKILILLFELAEEKS